MSGNAREVAPKMRQELEEKGLYDLEPVRKLVDQRVESSKNFDPSKIDTPEETTG